jgi:hypothetical protein
MADPAKAKSLAVMNFEDDLKAASEAPDAARWKFERRADLELWVTVSPLSAPTETFVARLLWLDYPGAYPPSVKFVEPATGQLNAPKAWPTASGFRPPSLDICANWTAEGFKLHPEWATTQHRWIARGNIILKTMRTLQGELDTSYGGRFYG